MIWKSSRRLIQGLRVLYVQSMIARAAQPTPIEILLELAARAFVNACLGFMFPTDRNSAKCSPNKPIQRGADTDET